LTPSRFSKPFKKSQNVTIYKFPFYQRIFKIYFECGFFYKLHKDAQRNVKCIIQPELHQSGFEVIEYERGHLRRDDFVTIISNGTYSEPWVNNTYPFDAKIIINSNSAKLTINSPGNWKKISIAIIQGPRYY